MKKIMILNFNPQLKLDVIEKARRLKIEGTLNFSRLLALCMESELKNERRIFDLDRKKRSATSISIEFDLHERVQNHCNESSYFVGDFVEQALRNHYMEHLPNCISIINFVGCTKFQAQICFDDYKIIKSNKNIILSNAIAKCIEFEMMNDEPRFWSVIKSTKSVLISIPTESYNNLKEFSEKHGVKLSVIVSNAIKKNLKNITGDE